MLVITEILLCARDSSFRLNWRRASSNLARIEDMNGNVLLIANRDVCSNEVVAKAIAQTGCRFQHAKSSRDAYYILSTGLEDIDAIIIDLDPALHSLSILEAISLCKNAPPVIVVAVPAELDMTAIAYRHGAAACIKAPFNARELATILEDVCLGTTQPQTVSCDLWGHPHPTADRVAHRSHNPQF
jgi:DNA-binding NtrC family response regulator